MRNIFCILLTVQTTTSFSCPPGHTLPNCSLCKKGTFKNNWGNFTCIQCGDGMYSNISGAQRCHYCDEGTYASTDHTQCLRCPNNTISPKGASSVMECMAIEGFYCTPPNLARLCPEGFYCPRGIMRPIPCPLNTHSSIGSKDCVKVERSSLSLASISWIALLVLVYHCRKKKTSKYIYSVVIKCLRIQHGNDF